MEDPKRFECRCKDTPGASPFFVVVRLFVLFWFIYFYFVVVRLFVWFWVFFFFFGLLSAVWENFFLNGSTTLGFCPC